MQIGAVRETHPGERRVALVPAAMKALSRLGLSGCVEFGAGESAGYADAEYAAAGWQTADRDAVLKTADVVVRVRALNADNGGVESLPSAGRTLVAMCDPLSDADAVVKAAESGVRVFALELVPRITRAQSMDVLSSMASLAGYKAVLLGAAALPKQFPMMMTAAGTVKPARVFVIGAGVAGLQAIATAKRLGAVVTATDVRPSVKEQVESLGGRFVDTTTVSGEGTGGYAKELTDADRAEQRRKLADAVREADVVITTAAVPGRKAPTLLTADMVEAMSPGGVVVDLAAERGGNCELTRPGETVEHAGVTVLGPDNLPSTLAKDASLLFSNNVCAFLKTIVADGELSIDGSDEIVRGSMLCEAGEVVHPRVRKLAGLPEHAALSPDPFAPDEPRSGEPRLTIPLAD